MILMAFVLVVDDEVCIRRSLSLILGRDGHTVVEAKDGREAFRKLEMMVFDVAIVDLRLPDADGLEVIQAMRRPHKQTEVVAMTASTTPEVSAKAIEAGACHVLAKPFTERQLRQAVDAATTRRLLRLQATRTTAGTRQRSSCGGIVGISDAMQRVFNLIEIAAPTDHPILIRAEAGTNRELLARVIHDSSWRRGKPFATVDCRSIDNGSLESLLFGHVKGAFSGATRNRRGLFEKTSGGSTFLDGIGQLSPILQMKLLMLLQDSVMQRVGERRPRRADVRLICGTDEDLHSKVLEPRFRRDLLSRLETISIQIPPLRKRREDIPLLVRDFLHRQTDCQGNGAIGIADDAMRLLIDYDWPGNTAELEHALEHAVTLSEGARITRVHLPHAIRKAPAGMRDRGGVMVSLRDLERAHILEVLDECEGNQTVAARKLKIGRTTLWRKIREYQR